MVRATYIYRFIPKRVRVHLNELLRYNGSPFDLPRLIDISLLFGVGMSIILSIITQLVLGINFLFFIPIYLISILFIIYVILVLSADSRGAYIDSMLPDFLRLMAANMKTGIDPAKAIFVSIRPEFGPLAYEMNIVGKEVLSGKTLPQALMNLKKRVKSKNLETTVDLIIVGIKAGKGLPDSLNKLAEILKERELLRKEVKANVLMYIYLIIFGICIGGPLLFSVSTFLYQTLYTVASIINTRFVNVETIPSSYNVNMSIRPEFMFNFSLISIIVSAIVGSLIIGLILNGKERTGVKYILPFTLLAVFFFFVVRYTLNILFGGYFRV